MSPFSSEFSFSEKVSYFDASPAEILASFPGVANLLAGTLIFRPAQEGQADDEAYEVLLIRRSPTDTFPLKWETPVGTADQGDNSVLGVAVRELWEETRLRAKEVQDSVGLKLPDGQTELPILGGKAAARKARGSDLFLLDFVGEGDVWAAAFFIATLQDPEAEVMLQPDEHIDYAWASEDEVRNERLNARDEKMEFASEAMKNVLLHGFEKKRNMPEMS